LSASRKLTHKKARGSGDAWKISRGGQDPRLQRSDMRINQAMTVSTTRIFLALDSHIRLPNCPQINLRHRCRATILGFSPTALSRKDLQRLLPLRKTHTLLQKTSCVHDALNRLDPSRAVAAGHERYPTILHQLPSRSLP
jgi:hypothetical protein